MKKALFLVVICIFAGLFTSSPASSAYLTGSGLVNACSSKRPQDVSGCIHYITGIIDYHITMQSFGTMPKSDFCLPVSLPIEDAAYVVFRYLKQHPENNDFIAASAVTMALFEKYPCGPPLQRKKKTKKKHAR